MYDVVIINQRIISLVIKNISNFFFISTHEKINTESGHFSHA
jgi:hypothetical protein